MSKYKNPAYADEMDDDKSYSEEMQAQQEAASPEETEPAANAEDASFKKRYGDLRRHMQHKEQEFQKQMDQMKQQLDQATKQQIRFPKTDEEIEQWSQKYPDVAKIVDTIARKRANEALEEGEKRMESLKKLETQVTRDKAETELLKLHPDFSDIRQDPAFHEWAQVQPTYIQDALYKNNTDAHAAARAIDLYKADTGKGRKRKAASDNPREAAQDVGRTSRTSPNPSGKAKFTESQVSRMSEQEYDKNEDAILEAMRNGNFEYDLTGAAR
jgi:hypothetical protein